MEEQEKDGMVMRCTEREDADGTTTIVERVHCTTQCKHETTKRGEDQKCSVSFFLKHWYLPWKNHMSALKLVKLEFFLSFLFTREIRCIYGEVKTLKLFFILSILFLIRRVL